MAAGAGRDVLTGTHSRSASATVFGVAPPSTPSSYDFAPMTTCSGTTTMPRSSHTSRGNVAVESVTSAMGMDRRLPVRVWMLSTRRFRDLSRI